MPIFSLSTNVHFTHKPQWLDAFKQKHNRVAYEYHVTLKQPCFVSEINVPTLKQKVHSFFNNTKHGTISVVFDRIVADDSDVAEQDGCIMIFADNAAVNKLQRDLIAHLSDFTQYVSPKTAEYERNFRPHITIADALDRPAFDHAQAELPSNAIDNVVQGEITQVVLTIITGDTDKREEYIFSLSN